MSRTTAHNAAPAIRQIIWRLADWGQPPCEVITLWTLEGGLGWKCVSLAPCGAWQGKTPSLKSCSGPYTLQAESAAVPALWSLPEGLFVLWVCLFVPLTHTTDVQPVGFLVGSCKPPVCSGLYSYGGATVMVVQVPYTCKWGQADTL